MAATEECQPRGVLKLNSSRGIMFNKSILEAVLFIAGVVIVSAILGWLAWNNLGSLVADAPEAVNLKGR
jgi:hypothetical protein